jgi:hypothetical protein
MTSYRASFTGGTSAPETPVQPVPTGPWFPPPPPPPPPLGRWVWIPDRPQAPYWDLYWGYPTGPTYTPPTYTPPYFYATGTDGSQTPKSSTGP